MLESSSLFPLLLISLIFLSGSNQQLSNQITSSLSSDSSHPLIDIPSSIDLKVREEGNNVSLDPRLCIQKFKDKINDLKYLFGGNEESKSFLRIYKEENLVQNFTQSSRRFYNFVNKLVEGEKNDRFEVIFCHLFVTTYFRSRIS